MDSASQKIDTHFDQTFTTQAIPTPVHEQNLTLEGMEDLFNWASEMVADGQDVTARRVKEQKIRRRVLEVVQKAREQKVASESTTEVAYLQRRLMALLQRMSALTEENSQLKQIILAQLYGMQIIPELEAEVKQLKHLEIERADLIETQESLMNVISKVKVERDILDDLLRVVELENDRISRLLQESREQVKTLSARRWWHYFVPKSMRGNKILDVNRG